MNILIQLFRAARAGDEDELKLLLEKGVDIEMINSNGDTVLQVAADVGERGIMELLIANGANIEVVNREGKTILHVAAIRGNTDTIKLLIEKGANMNTKDNNGYTALHSVIRYGFIEAAKLLIANGANANTKTKYGDTPLHIAASQRHKEIVELLIEKIDNTDTIGSSSAGSSIDETNHDGKTLLVESIERRDINLIKQLIAKGADVNAICKGGNTALHVAAGDLEIYNLLIANGAKTDVKNNDGDTPYVVALKQEQEEVIRLIKNSPDY